VAGDGLWLARSVWGRDVVVGGAKGEVNVGIWFIGSVLEGGEVCTVR